MKTTYTTRGSVRGSCGHKHRTITAAVQCAKKDMCECANRYRTGYSDRYVRAVENGQERQLTTDEHSLAWGYIWA